MKNANKAAIKYFKELLKKSDIEICEILDKKTDSNLSELLNRSGVFNSLSFNKKKLKVNDKKKNIKLRR